VGHLKERKQQLKQDLPRLEDIYLLTVIQREDADSVEIKGICKELDLALESYGKVV